jgi:hypothetical protein
VPVYNVKVMSGKKASNHPGLIRAIIIIIKLFPLFVTITEVKKKQSISQPL